MMTMLIFREELITVHVACTLLMTALYSYVRCV
jgi:hypothetical protein